MRNRCEVRTSSVKAMERETPNAVSYTHLVNAFSAFTKWQPMPMRKLSPTVLKRFENFLRRCV